MLEIRGPVDRADEVGAEWGEDVTTTRILQAVDAFDRDRTAHDRSRSHGMGLVFVLLIGVILVLGVVVTLNELVTQAIRGVTQGL